MKPYVAHILTDFSYPTVVSLFQPLKILNKRTQGNFNLKRSHEQKTNSGRPKLRKNICKKKGKKPTGLAKFIQAAFQRN